MLSSTKRVRDAIGVGDVSEAVAADRQKTDAIWSKLEMLEFEIYGFNYSRLLAARLSKISERVTFIVAEDKAPIKRTLRPAARHLKAITIEMTQAFAELDEKLFDYVRSTIEIDQPRPPMLVIKIARLLLSLKSKIEGSGLLSVPMRVNEGEVSASVHESFNWVTYFSHVVVSAMQHMKLKKTIREDFIALTDKLQSLQDLVYQSLHKNFPGAAVNFANLEFKQRQLGFAAVGFFGSHESDDIKKGSVYLAPETGTRLER